ncbi:hypothetical protein ACTXT7_001537 [Hymenolepis weldensis]
MGPVYNKYIAILLQEKCISDANTINRSLFKLVGISKSSVLKSASNSRKANGFQHDAALNFIDVKI